MTEWRPMRRPAQSPVEFLRCHGHAVEPAGFGFARVDGGPQVTEGQLVELAHQSGWREQAKNP
jgi:hypothetical protein